MPAFLIYLFESSVCMALFYALYALLFSRLTHFNINRFYLLLSVLMSLVIPILSFKIFPIEVLVQNSVEPINPIIYNQGIGDSINVNQFSTISIWFIIYITGVICTLSFTLKGIGSITSDIINGHKKKYPGFILIDNQKNKITFSFLNYIFHPQDEALEREVVSHELVHINQWHTIDILFIQLVKAMLWFNPFAYLMQNAIKLNHEYICDHLASKTSSPFEYALFLGTKANLKSQYPLVNTFAHQLKNRIIMLEKSINNSKKITYYLLAIPLAMIMLYLFSCDSYVEEKQVLNPDPVYKTVTQIDTVTTFDYDTYEESMTIVENEVDVVEFNDTIVNYDYQTGKKSFSIEMRQVPVKEYERRTHPILKNIYSKEINYRNTPQTKDTVFVFDGETYEEMVTVIDRDQECYGVYWSFIKLRSSQNVSLTDAQNLLDDNIKIAEMTKDNRCEKIKTFKGKIVVVTTGKDPMVMAFDNKMRAVKNFQKLKDLLEPGLTKIYIEGLEINGKIPLKSMVLNVN